jgi:molecular chaperone GrpE (heat shock protein)
MKAAILLKNILATIEKLNTLEFEHRAEEVFGSEEMGATTDLNEKKSELEVIENLAKEVNKLSDLFKILHAEKEELKRRLNCTEELANLGSWVLDYETKKMIWSE